MTVDKATNDIVVIELKIGKVHDSTLGQILRYMGYVTNKIAQGKNVRGLILGEHIDEKVQYGLSLVPTIEFKKYSLNINIT